MWQLGTMGKVDAADLLIIKKELQYMLLLIYATISVKLSQ